MIVYILRLWKVGAGRENDIANLFLFIEDDGVCFALYIFIDSKFGNFELMKLLETDISYISHGRMWLSCFPYL